MWISNNNDWNSSHTDLSKYFIERIKQQVDFEEIISNRHKSTNGFTLVKEIIEVSQLAIKREKSINRLISLVTEAKSELLKSSIYNDFILNKYYSDIVEYYKNLNPNKLKDNQKNVSDLLNQSLIHYKRLKINYFQNIIDEIKLIDFKTTQFERTSKLLDSLIDCIIPYLINIGYSTTSISSISYKFIKKNGGDRSSLRILTNFLNAESEFEFVIKTQKESIELKTICDYLNQKGVSYQIIENYNDISTKFANNIHTDHAIYIKIIRKTIDPHNYLRNLYEITLKKYVVSKNRQDLSPLNDFFERVYWRFNNNDSYNFEKSNFNLDPLNVVKRKNTLFDTLLLLSKSYGYDFDINSELPFIEQISDSLYYYNLAIGSKSIENSMSLLWTSLETLLPYRLKDNDISNVQYFVSKCLSIGSIGRELTSFVTRYVDCNWINDKSLESIGLHTSYINYTKNGLKTYFEFLSKNYSTSDDPFNIINSASKLLAKEFCRLNDIYTGKHNENVNYWIQKINHSQESISFQLDRIYLHRNQIVHSGKFINEYSNLWNHLEWYVGKLLSYCVIEYFLLEKKERFDKKEIFMNLEANIDNIKNQLNMNKDKKITDIYNIALELLTFSWQFT